MTAAHIRNPLISSTIAVQEKHTTNYASYWNFSMDTRRPIPSGRLKHP
jgi:hypothetical protein